MHEGLKTSSTGKKMQLDIFLPKELIAFEYQGEQHYQNIYAIGNWNQKEKDEEKRKLCIENEITLIEIPYWWDWKQSTLISIIKQQRADLLLDIGETECIILGEDYNLIGIEYFHTFLF